MRLSHTTAFLTLACLNGCGYVHNLRYEMSPAPMNVALIDSRPTQDKVDTPPREPLPFSGYVVGDEHFSPDRVAILRHRLATKFGGKLQGKKVVLTQLRSMNINTRPTNLDAIVSGSRPISQQELGISGGEQFRYWVVCDISLEIDGRRIQARGTDGYNGPIVDYPTHHRNALMRAIDQLVSQL